MGQARGRARLEVESLDLQRRRPRAGQDELQGDDAIQSCLTGFVDDPHAAAAELTEKHVLAELAGRAGRGAGARPTGRAVGGLGRVGIHGPLSEI